MPRKKKETVYVVHHCKNCNQYEKKKVGETPTGRPRYERTQVCNNAFTAPDLTNAKVFPPTYMYCPECTAKGYTHVKSKQKVDHGKSLSVKRKINRG